ncbi:putative ATP-dependent DNA helicase Q1 [Perca flavescens]|uniref:putative ATP-dependent DNA helicase Q1 n=1 Tax=Perca flavescens TaxID=8167 RepID=UPI00106E4CF5|nr:putative ATP-dependent DNA helicase Q1 [Perca flavescens]
MNDTDILHGRFQLVFGRPESWLLNEKWRNLLSSEVYRDNLVGIVVYDVHVTYKWGEGAKGEAAFRESFARLGELRSIAKDGTPVLALTASADTKNRRRVTKLLHMENATEVTVSPNRTNLRLGLTQVPSNDFSCMDWVVKEVKDKALSMSPIIIYCKSVGKVFSYIKAELGEDAWIDRDQDHKAENLLIGMFHSKTLTHHKQRVLLSFNGEGSCRVVVATTALGMGLNFPNVSHVVMYGSPDDVEDIVQQAGRAGRNGLQSHAILYVIKQSIKVDKAVKDVIGTGTHSCFRKALLSNFEEHTTSVEPGHLCCTYCHSVCSCASEVCGELIPKHELLEPDVFIDLKCRAVTEDDKTLVRDMLEEYRSSLVNDTARLFTSRSACTGFSTELIEAVVEHSKHIFDLAYIITNLPVFRARHAREILLVISEVFGDIELDIEPTSHKDSFTEPDIDYTGYFDEDEDSSEMGTQHSSTDSDYHHHSGAGH